MFESRYAGRLISCAVVLVGLSGICGCGPQFEASPDAVAWSQQDRDPFEDCKELGRWPGWRGPNASGIVRGGSPPVVFGPDTSVRWKTAVPGTGNSSPVAWDDAVFVTSALDDASPSSLVVLCYDRATGKLRWQADAGESAGGTHSKNGYASASVATDGKFVFASFGMAGLSCYDFSGKKIWHADLGPLQHMWGTAASPVLFGDLVIQLCDYEGDSYIAAFHKSTGKQAWKTDRPSRGCWTTPVLATVKEGGKERTELIVNGTTTEPSGKNWVIAYDPADGRELWRVGGTSTLVTPTILLAGDLVFSTSGRNGAIMAIKPGGSGDVTQSRVVWRAASGGPYIPTGVVYRNRLYILGDSGHLVCYNPGNGQEIWRGRLGGDHTSSLVAADGRIYAISESGRVSVCKAGDSFELLATNRLRAPCLTTPAIVDGDLLIRTDHNLYCFEGSKPEAAPSGGEEKPSAALSQPASNVDVVAETPQQWPVFRGDATANGLAQSGLPEKLEPLWTFSVNRGGFESTAAIVDGAVYIGSTDGKLYSLDLSDGKKRWEFSTQLGFTASASVLGGRVFIGDTDGRFYAIDAATGEKIWNFASDNEISSGANFYKDTVLFGSQDTNLYCLKAASGELVWKYESPDQIRGFPSIVGDYTFVAGCDGRLHRIDLANGKSLGDIDLGSPTGSTPAIVGERAFVGTEGNEFLAIDWKQGKVLWRYRNPQRPSPFRSSAAVTPDRVVVGSRDRQVHALDPNSGEKLWTFATKSRVDSSPVIVGRRVFVGSADGRLYELDLKSGEERWRFEAGGEILASPAVAEGRLVIGNDRGTLYCFGEKKSP